MSLPHQEEKEWSHLLAFREALPDFPEGSIDKHQRPDFRVTSPSGILGIEHTRIYQKSEGRGIPQQARERYMTQITVQAEELYDSRDNPGVIVYPSFSSGAHLNARNVDKLAEKLAAVVERNIPAMGQTATLRQTWRPRSSLPRQFRSVRIIRLNDPSVNFWRPPMGGWIPDLPSSYVQERIDDKNAKISDYREQCDAVWLLVVIDGSRPSSFFDISEDTLQHEYDSLFDRTYLFNFQTEAAHEL